MAMRILVLLGAAAVLSLAMTPAEACTSFAWFGGGGPLYGMNFDWYPQLEIVFSVSSGPDGRDVFTMSYRQGDTDPIQTVGMNSHGLFATMQVVDTDIGTGTPGEGEAMVWMPYVLAMWLAGGLDDIDAYLDTVRLVQYEEIPLHLMLADDDGRALIVEVGPDSNRIFPMGDSEFLAMTNFSHWDSRKLEENELAGTGADRYRAACAGLAAAGPSLDVDGALAVLEAALNGSEGFPTRASMVMDPAGQEVYLAVEGDMERVWVISLADRKISGYRGVPEGLSADLPRDGITSAAVSRLVEAEGPF